MLKISPSCVWECGCKIQNLVIFIDWVKVHWLEATTYTNDKSYAGGRLYLGTEITFPAAMIVVAAFTCWVLLITISSCYSFEMRIRRHSSKSLSDNCLHSCPKISMCSVWNEPCSSSDVQPRCATAPMPSRWEFGRKLAKLRLSALRFVNGRKVDWDNLAAKLGTTMLNLRKWMTGKYYVGAMWMLVFLTRTFINLKSAWYEVTHCQPTVPSDVDRALLFLMS